MICNFENNKILIDVSAIADDLHKVNDLAQLLQYITKMRLNGNKIAILDITPISKKREHEIHDILNTIQTVIEMSSKGFHCFVTGMEYKLPPDLMEEMKQEIINIILKYQENWSKK